MHMMHDVWCMWSAVVCTCSGILACLPKRFSGQSPPPHQVAAVLAGCSLGTVDQTWHDGGKRPPKKISPLHPLGQESLSSHTHTIAHMHHASHIMCIVTVWHPNIHYIGHPCHSSDFWRTLKPKPSSKWNQNLAAIWGLCEAARDVAKIAGDKWKCLSVLSFILKCLTYWWVAIKGQSHCK